jgi:hypothetical protein
VTGEQQLAKALVRINNAEALHEYPLREALIACALTLAANLGYPVATYRGEAEPARATCEIQLPQGVIRWRVPPGQPFESLCDAVQYQRVGDYYNAHVPGAVRG